MYSFKTDILISQNEHPKGWSKISYIPGVITFSRLIIYIVNNFAKISTKFLQKILPLKYIVKNGLVECWRDLQIQYTGCKSGYIKVIYLYYILLPLKIKFCDLVLNPPFRIVKVNGHID